MRVVFAGTPPFAARALEALVRARHEVVLVLTQPDRPAGRGLKLVASAVCDAATALGLRIEKPRTLKDPASAAVVREAAADVMVVAAYGLLLPQAILDMPVHGCLNIHGSLLPRWRGAAPVQRAILAGDPTTGVCIMRMEAGLDTGPVLLRREIPIGPRATAGALMEELAALGAEAIIEALERLTALVPEPQDGARATYAAKVGKAEARIDWSRSNVEIDRQVRAFNPAPGAETSLGGVALKIWTAEPVDGSGAPGAWLDPGELVVACGSGALRLIEVQRPGARRMPATAFANGNPEALRQAFA
ncbi:MAG: methionyl-tRNA formyltransferase [Betaproteobacteria bacterium]